MEKEKVVEQPRRKAVLIIKQLEAIGGFYLECGCFVASNANEMRRLMEITGPEVILEITTLVKCDCSVSKVKDADV